MPFGIKTPRLYEFVLFYLDDIVIYSADQETYLQHLHLVPEPFQSASLGVEKLSIWAMSPAKRETEFKNAPSADSKCQEHVLISTSTHRCPFPQNQIEMESSIRQLRSGKSITSTAST